MDSFIDRLAHRFTAQEIIKANATAEAEELKRTREQVRQYEVCLEEMKSVNESMKDTLTKLEEAMNNGPDAGADGKLAAEDLEEINRMLEEVMTAVQKSKEESLQQQDKLISELQELQNITYGQVVEQQGDLENIRKTQSAMFEQLNERLQTMENNVSGQMDERMHGMENNVFGQVDERIQGMETNVFGQMDERMQGIGNELLDQMYEQMQGVQGNVTTQLQDMKGGVTNQLQEIQGGVATQLQEMEGNVVAKLQDVQGSVATQLQDMESKLSEQFAGQVQDIQIIRDVQGKIPGQLFAQLQSVQDKLIAQMKSERALAESEKETNNMFSDIQVAVLKELTEAQAEGTKEQIGTRLTEQREQISDFVHKENVKVYRNVQAVVVDESNKQSDYLSSMINKVTAKNEFLLRMVIVSCACSGASLAAVIILILRSLGIL